MKYIPLTAAKAAMVDDADYPWLIKYRWYAAFDKPTNKYYARRHLAVRVNKYKKIRMHREIMGVVDPKIQVDHKNGDTLDNRRENLRIATSAQNNANHRMHKSNKSGFKGVCWDKRRQRWRATIFKGKQYYLGYFDTPESAHDAYVAKALELFGEFARTS
jgi:hypothetical protein